MKRVNLYKYYAWCHLGEKGSVWVPPAGLRWVYSHFFLQLWSNFFRLRQKLWCCRARESGLGWQAQHFRLKRTKISSAVGAIKKRHFLKPSDSCGLFCTAYALGLAAGASKSLQLWFDLSAHRRLFRVFFGIPFCRNAVKHITSLLIFFKNHELWPTFSQNLSNLARNVKKYDF